MEYKREKTKQRDLKILKELYDLRVLTADQLANRFGFTKGSMYHFMSRLLKSCFVQSTAIKGFAESSGLRGKYYSITNKGIRFLSENGFEVEGVAESLKVSDMRVPYELTVNGLYYEFREKGWGFKGSREAKKEFGINRGNNIHVVLSSPVFKDYPFYLLINIDTISDV